jgi:hypothetical protein
MVFIFTVNTIVLTGAAAIRDVTLEEALEWAQSHIGTYYDFDGIDGSQCIDLVYGYYDFFGAQFEICNLMLNIPQGFTRYRLADTPNGVQPGDIFVRRGASVGHVGIIVSVSDNANFTAIEANSNGSNSYSDNNTPVYKIRREDYEIWGVVRPTFARSIPTIYDALEILKYLAGIESTVNNVTLDDAMVILKYLAGIEE